MLELGVNIDHVATLRQQRYTPYPDPLLAALIAEEAGADLITVHLREDRRHIQYKDVVNIRKKIKTKLNLECAITKEMLDIAVNIMPDIVCLVPEKREELTTEGGLNILESFDRISSSVNFLKNSGIRVSLFIDPDIRCISEAAKTGAHAIELHTGKYAEVYDDAMERALEISRIKESSLLAMELGLQVNAGHGLHYENIQELLMINGIKEFNIGHAIISKAIFSGMYSAVKLMKDIISSYSK
ncbi:pyridoxine 5'-phosphate synthase [Candidatus Kinetoplastidibacterium desouzai]|nr:pyridoxine 5'-phosphate synthase [Candidatus Kinetoplastibacterium desouzaii]